MSFIRLTKSLTLPNVVGVALFSMVLYSLIISVRNWQSLYSFFSISDSWAVSGLFWLEVLLHPTANFDVLSTVVLLAFCLLAAFQMMVWLKLYNRQKTQSVCPPNVKPSKLSLFGGLAAIVGVGCAACGAALLVSFLGLFGVSSLLLILPLHGVEIGIIGIFILVYTNYRLIKVW